jgi:hypothetical protein
MTTKEALLMEMATRKYSAGKTSVARALDLVSELTPGACRADIIACFRQLDADGYGRFLCGRRGHPSRFHWAGGVSPRLYGKYYGQAA